MCEGQRSTDDVLATRQEGLQQTSSDLRQVNRAQMTLLSLATQYSLVGVVNHVPKVKLMSSKKSLYMNYSYQSCLGITVKRSHSLNTIVR